MKMLVQDIFEIEDVDNLDKILQKRVEKMDKIVSERSNYYIVQFPEREVEDRWTLVKAEEYSELFEQMSIKEGVNMYATERGFEFVAYYGSYKESLCLYPISDEKAKELRQIIDNAEFDESIVIDAEIAQYCY